MDSNGLQTTILWTPINYPTGIVQGIVYHNASELHETWVAYQHHGMDYRMLYPRTSMTPQLSCPSGAYSRPEWLV